uniref:Uncharacterized protein n=1 Tax=Aureoumbra lagunensis TaxID=44058 RepID=A0A7S3JQI5_9STRA
MKEVESLRKSIDEDSIGLHTLRNQSESARIAVLESIEEYGKLVVFMQHCEDDISCGSSIVLNHTEQIRALLKATASRESKAMAEQLARAKAEISELRSYIKDTAIATTIEHERLQAELYRLASESDKHEAEANRLRESDTKRNKQRDQIDAEKASLEKTVADLQRRQAYECDMATQHDDIILAPGILIIVRLYEEDHGEEKLRWALAEVIAIVEGDGRDPDSLLQVRLFKDKIKSASKYALDSSFVRDFFNPHWIRRDTVAYVDVQLSGVPDRMQHKLAYAPDVLIRGIPYHNKTEISTDTAEIEAKNKDEKKSTKRNRENTKKRDLPDRKSPRKDSASGVKVAESEKRAILARLERDEARWEKRRDNSEPHGTKIPESGQYAIWSFEFFNSTGGPELWFRIGTVLHVLDLEITLQGFEPPLKYPLNETELGERFNLSSSEYTVHRNNIVYVDLAMHEAKNPRRDKHNNNEQSSFTLKSTEKKSAARVLRQATGRWLAGFEYRAFPACHCPEPPPCPVDTCPEPERNKTITQISSRINHTEELPAPPENATDFLDHLKLKLQWLIEVHSFGLLSSDEVAFQRTKILSDFEQLGALPPRDDNKSEMEVLRQ